MMLALAVLVAPSTSRGRAPVLVPARRRLPVAAWGILGCLTVSFVLPLSAVVSTAVMLGVLMLRRRARRRRRDAVEEAIALQGALDVLVAELRVGAHPVAAMRVAARESGGRVAGSFGAVAARALLGADVAAGLRAEARHSRAPGHWERLAVCWQLAQSHGLAIATLMQAAQRDLGERERFRSRVDAGMAGARATGSVLAGLPLLGVLLGCAIGADPLGFLFSSGPGGWLLCLGTLLVGAGLLWSDRITARVLT
ncbi:type II secretion system F family protein [Mycolicibacterium psychrotolerans]|nr:type II secretion system F family protein [Mycolicibacterium psychrotolerans]